MSTEHDTTAAAGQDGRPADQQFVTFSVADETFAVPMAPVQEIIRVPEVAQLPLAPTALQGLANLRGRVLPIVSLRRLFGLPEREHDDATRAVVIQIGQPLGFVVDRVASVVSVAAQDIEPADSVRSIIDTEAFAGVINRGGGAEGQRLMPILDFDRLVERQFAAASRESASGLAGGSAVQATMQGTDAHEAHDDELRVVSFVVAGQEYAIRIDEVQEIVQRPERVTTVPNSSHHVLGLMSLRSRLLPLVSLRALFGLPPVAVDEQHRVVVVGLPGGAHVGLVTDTVKEVLGVPLAQADRVPEALARGDDLAELSSICRLDDGRRLVSVIDTGRLLGLQAMQQAVQAAERMARDDETAQSADGADEEQDMSTPMNTRHVATDDDLQLVIFRLDAEEFGVPITSVQEIVRVPEVLTRVPRTPPFVEGVINLRGTVLPVIDQRKRLGLSAIERSDRQRIMVYALGGTRTGFIVDSVAEVLRVPRAAIAPAPDLGGDASRLISQVARIDGNRRLVMLIEPEQLLGAQERAAVASSATSAGSAGSTRADEPPVALAA